MRTRTDYGQLAAKLDYDALEKKFTQLAESEPPKTRKTAADALEPLREQLLALYHKGWTSNQLVQELKNAGVPVSPARFRECLSRWTGNGQRTSKSRGRQPQKGRTGNGKTTAPPPHIERDKNVSGNGPRIARIEDL